MVKIQRILFPTDFSESSKAALEYACGLAEQNGSELHVLHVVEEMAYLLPSTEFAVLPYYVDELKLEEQAKKSLNAVVDPEWAKGRTVYRTVRTGSPFLQVLLYAKENKIDLIVMSTHGRTGLSHLLMGSVAENVVRKATCPVLTVHPSDHAFVMP